MINKTYVYVYYLDSLVTVLVTTVLGRHMINTWTDKRFWTQLDCIFCNFYVPHHLIFC